MTNARDVTYTVQVSVPISGEQRELLRAHALKHNTAMSIVCREEGLKLIGRTDLSLAEDTAYPIGKMLDRSDRPSRKPKRNGARLKVNLTHEQHRAFKNYATARGTRVSAVLRDAGLRAAKIAPLKPLALGRPLGH